MKRRRQEERKKGGEEERRRGGEEERRRGGGESMVATSSDLMVATSMICPSVCKTKNESNSANQFEREAEPSDKLVVPCQSRRASMHTG